MQIILKMNNKHIILNENCLRITNRAWEYFADEISPLERNRIDQHLVKCEDCTLQFEKIHLLHLTIEDQKKQSVNQFMATRILSRSMGKSNVIHTNSIKAEVIAILIIAIFVIGGVFTGSFFAGEYIRTGDSQSQANRTEILVDQTVYHETEYAIPGYEILNEKP